MTTNLACSRRAHRRGHRRRSPRSPIRTGPIPAGPSRRSFSRAATGCTARFEAAGLETRIDAAGNLIGHRAGQRPGSGTIMVGSHSDTVPDGGRFDGIAGVSAALEVARALADQRDRTRPRSRDRRFPCRGGVDLRRLLHRQPRHDRPAAGRMAGPRGDGLTLREGIAEVGGHPGIERTAQRHPGLPRTAYRAGAGARRRRTRYRHRHRHRRDHPHRDHRRGPRRPCRHHADGLRARMRWPPQRGWCSASSRSAASFAAGADAFRRHRRRVRDRRPMPPTSCRRRVRLLIDARAEDRARDGALRRSSSASVVD